MNTGRLVGPAEAGRVMDDTACFLLLTGDEGAEPADADEEKNERSGVMLEILSLRTVKGPS